MGFVAVAFHNARYFMKIVVMAAGGLGGYFGALLARNGNDVTFIARGEHLRAIQRNGLTVESPHGSFAIKPAKATDAPSKIGTVDWILFAVKTYDTDQAAKAIRQMVGKDTTVITFQNGVESYDKLAARIGKEHVIVAPTQITSAISSPGVIHQDSAFRICQVGEMDGNITPRVEWFVDQMKRCGVDAKASDQMPKPLWMKWILLASWAGLTTLARTEGATLFKQPAARETLRAAIQEAFDVAQAHGIWLAPDAVQKQFAFAMKVQPGNIASMHRDLLNGRRLEIDALSGAVVRLGDAKNVKTPVHHTIYVALKIEDERAGAKARTS